MGDLMEGSRGHCISLKGLQKGKAIQDREIKTKKKKNGGKKIEIAFGFPFVGGLNSREGEGNTCFMNIRIDLLRSLSFITGQ